MSSSSVRSAAAVSREGFSFVNGELFAQASSQHWHRRATVVELHTHYASGTDTKQPGHWFEAQLIHYGLKPSTNRAVARMRLYDAVQDNALVVPAFIVRLEDELKREWTLNDRALKRASSTTTNAFSAGVKRKADAEVDRFATVNDANSTTTTTTKTHTSSTTTTTTNIGQTNREENTSKYPCRSEGRSGITPGSTRATPTSVSSDQSTQSPDKRQWTRQNAPSMGQDRMSATSVQVDSEHRAIRDEYHEYYTNDHGFSSYTDNDYCSHGDGCFESQYQSQLHPSTHLTPLGLLNGSYNITSDFISQEWPRFGYEFSLTLTLDGSSLWGRFDFGIIDGHLLIPERPWSSSHDSLNFTWRGQKENEEIVYAGDNNFGSITFLGDGYIEGFIDYMGISFQGRRAPGQGTTSSIRAFQMQHDWDAYSERQSDYLDKAQRRCMY